MKRPSAGIAGMPLGCLSLCGAFLIWLAQPPLGLSWLAWVAVIPWLHWATREGLRGRDYVLFFAVATVYWAVTMQGIRHAHPAMYAALAVFSLYLAAYSLTFVWLVRRCWKRESVLPFWLAVPLIGTGLECIRNYLLTGVSAVMLGHTQAPNAAVIQIADAFGSYGVTFLVLLVNAAIYQTAQRRGDAPTWRRWIPVGAAGLLLAITLGYGVWRLDGANALKSQRPPAANVALIGRDEEIVFVQDSQRELEIFDAYFRQTVDAARQVAQAGGSLDAIVWPESMFTGGLPWMLLDDAAQGRSSMEAATIPIIKENQKHFVYKSAQVQAAVRRVTGQKFDPDLIVGCSVVYFGKPVEVYSGVVHVGHRGSVVDWYGKTHLVMFGEYIPLIDYLPWVHNWVPPGMGVEPGKGPVPMSVGDARLSPNVCIETAVERVALNQVTQLAGSGSAPDAIVNVTNDGWFDRTSIVEHHLRCSQFVAAACRRPVLVAANGGPTVWIDGSGRVIERLGNDEPGAVIANFDRDGRWGLYQSIGDWPARLMAALCIWWMVVPLRSWRRGARNEVSLSAEGDVGPVVPPAASLVQHPQRR
ncbi:MAG: apolipoprotein N-acyltransferase [Planctomycetaceae bacterium]